MGARDILCAKNPSRLVLGLTKLSPVDTDALLGGKPAGGRGAALPIHPQLSPRLGRIRVIALVLPCAFMAPYKENFPPYKTLSVNILKIYEQSFSTHDLVSK